MKLKDRIAGAVGATVENSKPVWPPHGPTTHSTHAAQPMHMPGPGQATPHAQRQAQLGSDPHPEARYVQGAIARPPQHDPRMPKVIADLERQVSAALYPNQSHPEGVAQQGYEAPPQPSRFEYAVTQELVIVGRMLMEKNANYGNSALHPLRVFSGAHPIEQILVRIDDKLSRIRNGASAQGEDTVLDLIGYLVLLRIAQRGGV